MFDGILEKSLNMFPQFILILMLQEMCRFFTVWIAISSVVKSYHITFETALLATTLQTHDVYSELKRRWSGFHVLSTWNTRDVFEGYVPVLTVSMYEI